MIYTYYNFEILPIGANIKIKCTSSNIQAGIGESFFISSDTYHNSTMTFEYTNVNGIVVGIDTNLTVTNATWNGIKNGTYSFTLTENSNSTNNGIYIKLLCNKVSVPTFIYNDNNNGFNYLSESNGKVTIGSTDTNNYAEFASQVIISWSTDEGNKLYYNESNNPSWRRYTFYGFWEDNNGTHTGETIGMFFNHDSHDLTFTIPKLNGTANNFTDMGTDYGQGPVTWSCPGIKNFRIGYSVNIDGHPGWYGNTYSKIIGDNIKIYNPKGYYKSTNNIDTSIDVTNGLPTLYNLNNWKGKQFYRSGNNYFSPSEVTLQTVWY